MEDNMTLSLRGFTLLVLAFAAGSAPVNWPIHYARKGSRAATGAQ
jgi:hypothetical protein